MVSGAVNHQRVAFPHVLKRTYTLWPLGVLAARLVSEHLVQLDAIELTIRVLVDGADGGVPYAV